ncbi:hypothetical protein [Lysobacter claricitrinus]
MSVSLPMQDRAPAPRRAVPIASDADRLRSGLPLESGEALPPPSPRPVH